jgi:aldose 1-epimerase
VVRRATDRVTLWADEAFDWVQVFTGTSRGELGGIPGVAVEPMTCPPDAFHSGTGVIDLEPGSVWSGTWGLRLDR